MHPEIAAKTTEETLVERLGNVNIIDRREATTEGPDQPNAETSAAGPADASKESNRPKKDISARIQEGKINPATIWNGGTHSAEPLDDYGPGGLHPVHIDETYKNGRYEIWNKLGFGGSSTVWAAHDEETDKIVSLKFLKASDSENSNELRILKHLQESGLEHPGREYVSLLLDHFFHEGVNGRHLVLVTELVGESLYQFKNHYTNSRLEASLCRRVSRQMLLAVDFLHSCGVVHADLNNKNILFRWPDIDGVIGEPFINNPITRKDGAPLDEGLPKYLVVPMQFTISIGESGLFAVDRNRSRLHRPVDLKIIDFSSAFFESERLTETITAAPLTPPEMVFKYPLTKAMDIWGLACSTFYAATGDDCFDVEKDRRSLIRNLYETFDESCAYWILGHTLHAISNEVWTTAPAPHHYCIEIGEKHSIESMVREWLYLDDALKGNPKVQEYGTMLVQYLKRMLIVEADKRPTTQDLLSEEFIQEIPNYEYKSKISLPREYVHAFMKYICKQLEKIESTVTL